MGYSGRAISDLLRRKRQYEALGGSLSSHETEGIVKGALSAEADRSINASRIAAEKALRERAMAEAERSNRATEEARQSALAETIRSNVVNEAAKSEQAELLKKQMKDQELAGYMQTGITGLVAAPNIIKGGKAITDLIGITGGGMPASEGGAGALWTDVFPEIASPASSPVATTPALGAQSATTQAISALSPASSTVAAAPTIGASSLSAVSGMGAGAIPTTIEGVAIPTAASLSGGMTLATGEVAGATGAAGAAEAAGAAGAAGAASGFEFGLPGIAGAVGGQLAGELFGGEPGGPTQTLAGIGGGAAAGAAIGSVIPIVGTAVGAVIGGIVGGVTEVIEGSIICTELNRQGYLSDEVLRLDEAHRAEHIDIDTYRGYMKWAPTVVRWMRKSRIVAIISRTIGVSWALEMAHIMKPEKYGGNLLGKVLLEVGVPICRALGRKSAREVTL